MSEPITGRVQSPEDFVPIGVIHFRDATDTAEDYEVSACPTCYALVTYRAWLRHANWHRDLNKRTSPMGTRVR